MESLAEGRGDWTPANDAGSQMAELLGLEEADNVSRTRLVYADD